MSNADTLPTTPSFRLDGRRALVTGAGRGIGRGIAVALADAGAHVFCAARTSDDVTALATAIAANGRAATALTMDVSDIGGTASSVEGNGPFDILVNNAGGNRPAELSDITEDDYDAVTDVNVKALVFLTKAVARGMIEAGRGGSIINMSSQMGHVGGPKRTVYCATKHAIEGLTKALAWELGPHGIRVNTLCPTFVETPMTAHMLADAEFKSFVTSKIALGRFAEIEDIMGAALFLASDASAMVTGSALMVDGGWTAA